MGESGELGLNEHHQEQLVQFLRFARYQRSQRVRALDFSFDQVRKSQLNDATYTKDEIAGILKDLEEVLRAELESELINTSHTSLLLLRQMCGQAEKWHLKLSANLSELENRELLDAVQQFEESQFNLSGSKRPQITVLKQLEPIEGGGAAPLLQTEIARLKTENEGLKQRLRDTEGWGVGVAGEKEKLSQKLANVETALGDATMAGANAAAKAANVADLEAKMAALQGTLNQDLEQSKSGQQQLQSELTDAHKRMLEIQEELEMTEKELEKKFSQTGVYKNLKSMLSKKNQQIKKLRSCLSQYEPENTNEAEED